MTLARAQRSRKARRCATCRAVIEVGQTYWRHALPPHSDLGNHGWWTMVTCGKTTDECPDYWVIDSRQHAKDETLVVV